MFSDISIYLSNGFRDLFRVLFRGVVLRHLVFVLSLTLVVGCNSRFDKVDSDAEYQDVDANMSIQRLSELTLSDSSWSVNSDVIIRGCVTANDKGGNFYNSFVIEQDGYGVEILEGLSYNYVRYGEGAVVAVRLEGLCVGRSRGVVQVGLEASAGSSYAVDYMGHELLSDRHIVNTGYIDSVEPLTLTLESLIEDGGITLGEMCGRLVTIGGLTHVSDDTVWSGTHEFEDSEGRTLGCYTSSYASYSMVEVPTGEVSLTGVLQSYNGVPMVKMREESDCVEQSNI